MEVLEADHFVVAAEDRPAAAEALYERAFPGVARFVSKMRGSFDDARDIFHDALVIYFEKKEHTALVIHTSPEAYLLGIAKHLWLKKYRLTQRLVSLDPIEHEIEIPDDYFPPPSSKRMLGYLETAGKKCMELLRAFYLEKATMASIRQAFGYKTEHSATAQKYKCIEKVRETIRQQSVRYEDFVE